MKLFIACFTFVVFLATSNAQIKFPGPCPNVTVQQDLDIKRYLGTWYKQSSYPIGGIPVCYVTYSNLKGNTLLYTIALAKNESLQKVSTHVKYLGGGKFLQDDKYIAISRDFSALATDYVNYSIRYNCKNGRNSHEIFVGIITRSPNPSEDVVKAAKAKIAAQKLPVDKLTVPMSKYCKFQTRH